VGLAVLFSLLSVCFIAPASAPQKKTSSKQKSSLEKKYRRGKTVEYQAK